MHSSQGQMQSQSELGELYQEVILEHSRHPRFKSRPQNCQFCQDGKNPLCGDAITLYCEVSASSAGAPARISVSFDGHGCSISQASASILCERLRDVPVPQARERIRTAETIYTGRTAPATVDDVEDDLDALSGVSRFPVRVKCAALAWKTLELLLLENFDEEGRPLERAQAVCARHLAQPKKLRVVSTEGIN